MRYSLEIIQGLDIRDITWLTKENTGTDIMRLSYGETTFFNTCLWPPCVKNIRHLLKERFTGRHRVLSPEILFRFLAGVAKDPSNNLIAHRKATSGTKKNAEEINLSQKIMGWLLHYSRKEPKKNFWTKYPMVSRKSFIEKMSDIFDTGDHKPVSKNMVSPYDSRIISVPVFSFVNQVMSLISDPQIMSDEYLIKDYDIITGKCGTDFWDPNYYWS